MPDDLKDYGIPEKLRVKRRYTMSEAALEARRRNAQRSTGPKTEEGKAASSRNAWKHGLYATSLLGHLGRPCRSTCHKYDECELVRDKVVVTGENCLDRQFMAEAFEAVIAAIQDGKHEDFRGLAALEIAGAIEILRKLKEAILADGVVIKSEKYDKEGGQIGYEYVPHPALPAYMKMLEKLNMTPSEMLITPREIARTERDRDDDKHKDIATLMAETAASLARKVSGGQVNDD